MSWKKWMVALATFAVTTQVTPVSADRYDNYGCPSSDCGFSLCDVDPCDGWSIYADWLYWKVRKCDLHYSVSGVVQEAGFPLPVEELFNVSSVHSVHPSWDSGVRVGLLKAFGDMDIGIHYTYFQSKNSDESEEFGLATLINPFGIFGNYAASDYDVKLNQIDVEAGYHMEVSDCLAGRLFGGFRYASIKQNHNTQYDGVIDLDEELVIPVSSFLNREVDMDFYGLYVGSKASYNIFNCLDLFGSFSIGIGAAEFDRFNSTDITIAGSELISTARFGDDCWKTVTVVDLNVGVTFPVCTICCVDWAVSVGYEFHHWINTADFLHKVTETSIDIDGSLPLIVGGSQHFERHTDNLGFDGLFVRLSAAF